VTAPFLDDGGAQRLFGRSFLRDPENIPMAAMLCGVEGHKPFECVGTPTEACAALHLASQHPREREGAVVRWFVDVVPQGDAAAWVREALCPSEIHALSARWEAVLRGYLAAG
jgi:hypothetical protein